MPSRKFHEKTAFLLEYNMDRSVGRHANLNKKLYLVCLHPFYPLLIHLTIILELRNFYNYVEFNLNIHMFPTEMCSVARKCRS